MNRRWHNVFLLLIAALAVTWILQHGARAEANITDQMTPCINGMAGVYPCRNVDLLAHVPLSAMGAGEGVEGNDHWGWTDPVTGHDYVIFGLTNGTVFIDISDRLTPVVLGVLPGHDGESPWRDIKVYEEYAFITADVPTSGPPTKNGLQIFDLTQLRSVENPPLIFSETAHYDGYGPGHNLWINGDSGYLYAFRTDTCNGEMHMVNIKNPAEPAFAGCFAVDDAPLSDSECVIYEGPDEDYVGRELCFTGSDDNVSIADVTDKDNPRLIADFKYEGIARAHQGALTADQAYWLLSDTMDEQENDHNTRTYVFDVSNLDAPQILAHFEHGTTARDHNVYIVDNIAYQTNWRAGLRVLNITNLPQTNFLEIGYFDIVPASDSIDPSGAWSNYPWWHDGAVTVSGTDGGLFILRPTLPIQHLPVIASE